LDAEALRKFITRTGCPRVFADLDVSDMEGDAAYQRVLIHVGNLAEERLASRDFLRRPIFLRFTGAFGSGKTRLACWTLRHAYLGMLPICNAAVNPLFVKASDLVELRFQKRFGEADEDDERASAVRDRLFSSAFLVIDDVSRVAGYRGEELFVEHVVERRWEDLRSTVLTMNSNNSLSVRFADFLNYFDELPLVGGSRRARD